MVWLITIHQPDCRLCFPEFYFLEIDLTYAKLLLLALFMMVSACSLGQPDVPRTISGIILDKHTGKPLNGAKVSIEVKRKGRSGIGPEGLYSPKVWGIYSQNTGDLVDPDGWDAARREIGVFRFDLKQFHNADKLYSQLTVSKLIAEKSGYQSVTIEYPKN